MIIVGCSHGKHVAKSIAKQAGRAYVELKVEKFPDNEQHIIFKGEIPLHSKVVLVQSFHDTPDSSLIEVMFAAQTARKLGASSVSLMAPFFPYMRQDKSFSYGEVDSIHVLGKILSHLLNELYILDPHLHRERHLGDIFYIHAHKLTANPLIAEHIRKLDNPLIVGPDWESYKWAKATADMIGAESTILAKERFSARKVDVQFQNKVEVKGRHCVLIDDMISTGHTLLETIAKLKRLGAKKITCYAVHGLFVEGALKKLKQAKAEVITTNSVPNDAGKIDISGLFAEKIKK